MSGWKRCCAWHCASWPRGEPVSPRARREVLAVDPEPADGPSAEAPRVVDPVASDGAEEAEAVSYTHLDVYKRQPQRHVASVSLTSARTTRGEPPGDHTGNAGCRQDAPDEQQAGPAPVATRRR